MASSSPSPASSPPRTPPPKPPPPRSGHLSELSKQLRILQARNTAQASEIDRLERQLRILADLQGISVADLQRALQAACESEALGEWQSRVTKLRAELEAASLLKSTPDTASAAHQLAQSELRVGELEEVEDNLREEIRDLYRQLAEEKESAARFQTMAAAQIRKLKEQQPDEPNQLVNVEGPQPYASYRLDVGDETVEQQLMDERVTLLEQQLAGEQKQHQLRQAQFKARSVVQDERIQDLEQQLSSLYTAFGMVDEEHRSVQELRDRLQSHLDTADAEVARQLGAGFISTTRVAPSAPPPVTPTPTRPTSTVQQSIQYTPPPPQVNSQLHHGEVIKEGNLLLKTGTLVKKWKPRHAVLSRSFANYLLEIEGHRYPLHIGRSRVREYAKQPLAMVIEMDPLRPSATVLHVAAENEEDYQEWLAALTAAVVVDQGDSGTAPLQPGVASRGDLSERSGMSEQEASDLELALRLSEQDK